MNHKSGDYLELFNPAKNSYFPIRIKNIKETGLIVKILNTGKECLFQNYYMQNYPYKIPSISHKLLLNCGFVNKNNILVWERDNHVIIECLHGNIRNKNYQNIIFDNSIRFLCFKITKASEYSNFLKLLKENLDEENIDEFKKKNEIIKTANELFTKLYENGLTNLETDKIILKC